MKVIIEQELDGVVHKSTRDSSGVTAIEVLQECLDCMAGMGFQQQNIREAVIELAEEYEDLQNKEK